MEEVRGHLTGARREHGKVARPICCPGSGGRESESPGGNSHPLSAPAPSVCKEAVVSPVKVLELGRHWKSRSRVTELGTCLWDACTGELRAACHPMGSHLDCTATGVIKQFLRQRKKKSGLHLGEMNGI